MRRRLAATGRGCRHPSARSRCRREPGPPLGEPARSAQTFKCVQKIYSQTAGALKGFDFGVMLCTGPFGTGVQADNYSESVKRGGVIVSKGTLTDYFDAGSIRGAYTLTGKFTAPRRADSPVR